MGTTIANAAEGCRTLACYSRRSPAIHKMAEERLWSSGYLSLRDVACVACDDVLYLHGRLPSYFLKQLAQEIAAGVEGVRRVINRIDVLRPARPEIGRIG